MDSVGSSVRLAIKAPNQQFEDQVVECELDWTVLKLKSHLAEFYPSKPKVAEQKLIYSGQLLHDDTLLKDVLRWYEVGTPAVHTIHLVCVTWKDSQPVKEARKTNINDVPSTSSAPQMSPNPAVPLLPLNLSMDGLRQRTNNADTNGATRSFVGTMYGGTDISPPAFNMDPMMGQMMYMQQMYAQYMNQYMLQYYRGFGMNQAIIPPDATVGGTPPTEVNEDPGAVPVAEARQLDDRLNAQPPVNDDDENALNNRDWLDWFYMLSRSGVLLAIIYFYSSLSRFIAVFIIATTLYVYQIGWFQAERLHNNNNHLNVNNNDNHHAGDAQENAVEQRPEVAEDREENPAEPSSDEIVNDEQMRRETREIEEMMDRDNEAAAEVQDAQVSFTSLVRTFITSFFASIIPEQPGPINI